MTESVKIYKGSVEEYDGCCYHAVPRLSKHKEVLYQVTSVQSETGNCKIAVTPIDVEHTSVLFLLLLLLLHHLQKSFVLPRSAGF